MVIISYVFIGVLHCLWFVVVGLIVVALSVGLVVICVVARLILFRFVVNFYYRLLEVLGLGGGGGFGLVVLLCFVLGGLGLVLVCCFVCL